MRRTLVVAPLVLGALLVAGCDGTDAQNTSATPAASPSSSGSTAPAPSATAAISEEDFCDNIVAVFATHSHGPSSAPSAAPDPFTDLMADGVPAEMPSEAKDGVQVLIDNSGKLEDPKAIVEAYRALSSEERASVHALVTYVASACGADIIKGLVDLLPEMVPDELKSLSPSDLPSDLRELLPSELPSSLEGLIPQELATLIPEEWRSLIPEEYRDILESPSAQPST